MQIAILGRQYALGLAEVETIFGADNITPVGQIAALINTDQLDVRTLGGSPKVGRVVAELPGEWRRAALAIEKHYATAWREVDRKITLGISVYGQSAPKPRDIQQLGLALKKIRKHHPGSLRLIPNEASALSTATSHHNKLGLSPHKIELLIVQSPGGRTYLAESSGAQNITALAARDQARPRTDAFVGMLPPKLAQMMINLTGLSSTDPQKLTLLDPFCGTGVILQEALLMGYNGYGTDLSEKMIDYSQANLEWLTAKHPFISGNYRLESADAMKHRWTPPIDAVVCETYLGQPFSAPPSPAKLREVRNNCNHIISSFLRNIHDQLPADTPLTLAVPAWSDGSGHFTHLPLSHQLNELGYTRRHLRHVRPDQLLYYRESQVVARELLLLKKSS